MEYFVKCTCRKSRLIVQLVINEGFGKILGFCCNGLCDSAYAFEIVLISLDIPREEFWKCRVGFMRKESGSIVDSSRVLVIVQLEDF